MASTNEHSISYRLMNLEDIDKIVSLENTIWSYGLRAEKKLIRQRLIWQHAMLGAFKANRLIGMACWRYGQFTPTDINSMPINFNQFANQANQVVFNAAFVYNFALLPEIRNSKIGPQLIANGINILLENHCDYLVGASRCPSYTLTNVSSLRLAINDYPARAIPWEIDPTLSFYKKALNCEFTRPLVNFLPEDKESGGYAIGFYKKINQAL
ncbi:MAG TPA: hypothetical protein VK949_06245 [Methylotenera sp.]|nr:hypothetical protein [Methylotenera sp.]